MKSLLRMFIYLFIFLFSVCSISLSKTVGFFVRLVFLVWFFFFFYCITFIILPHERINLCCKGEYGAESLFFYAESQGSTMHLSPPIRRWSRTKGQLSYLKLSSQHYKIRLAFALSVFGVSLYVFVVYHCSINLDYLRQREKYAVKYPFCCPKFHLSTLFRA